MKPLRSPSPKKVRTCLCSLLWQVSLPLTLLPTVQAIYQGDYCDSVSWPTRLHIAVGFEPERLRILHECSAAPHFLAWNGGLPWSLASQCLSLLVFVAGVAGTVTSVSVRTARWLGMWGRLLWVPMGDECLGQYTGVHGLVVNSATKRTPGPSVLGRPRAFCSANFVMLKLS